MFRRKKGQAAKPKVPASITTPTGAERLRRAEEELARLRKINANLSTENVELMLRLAGAGLVSERLTPEKAASAFLRVVRRNNPEAGRFPRTAHATCDELVEEAIVNDQIGRQW